MGDKYSPVILKLDKILSHGPIRDIEKLLYDVEAGRWRATTDEEIREEAKYANEKYGVDEEKYFHLFKKEQDDISSIKPTAMKLTYELLKPYPDYDKISKFGVLEKDMTHYFKMLVGTRLIGRSEGTVGYDFGAFMWELILSQFEEIAVRRYANFTSKNPEKYLEELLSARIPYTSKPPQMCGWK
jgi:hypothetical protein